MPGGPGADGEHRPPGFRLLPFQSEPRAAMHQRTQRCYQVSAGLHPLISAPPLTPNRQQQGCSWTREVINFESSASRASASQPPRHAQGQRSRSWTAASPGSEYSRRRPEASPQTARDLQAVLRSEHMVNVVHCPSRLGSVVPTRTAASCQVRQTRDGERLPRTQGVPGLPAHRLRACGPAAGQLLNPTLSPEKQTESSHSPLGSSRGLSERVPTKR